MQFATKKEECYNKVVVFTPSHILEVKETDDLTISHEDLLYSMLSKEAWSDFNEQDLLKFGEAVIYYDNLVNLRAAHLAFNVGFSVAYETENSIIFFVSNAVSDEMIQYVSKSYETTTEKYLGVYSLEKKDTQLQVKCMETNFENIPHEEQYKMVFKDLQKTLECNNKEWKNEFHRSI